MYIIGVIGGNSVSAEIYDIACKVGSEIAKKKGVVVCGGLSGVMEAACKGAKSKGGTTIGILPGRNKDAANKYVDFAVATGIGEARNSVIVNTADGLVAVNGKEGTLSEIAFSLKHKKPIVGIKTFKIKGVAEESNPKIAVERLFEMIEKRK